MGGRLHRRTLLTGAVAAGASAAALPGLPAAGQATGSPGLLPGLSPAQRQFSGGGVPGQSQRVVEYLDGPAAGEVATLFSLPPGTAGVVTRFWLAGSGAAVLDAVLGISADQSPSPQVSQDLGVLFIASRLPHAAEGTYTASTEHMGVGVQGARADSSGYFNFGFPIPFGNGITIELESAADSLTRSELFFRVEYQLVAPGQEPPQRLHSIGARQRRAVHLHPRHNLRLAQLLGPGWAVYFSQVSTDWTNRSVLERDMGWFIDGDTLPVQNGAVHTPTGDGHPPRGPGIGSPSILSSGTEDFFYSGWYFLSSRAPISSPQSAVMLTGRNAKVFSAAVDIMAANGGYYFDQSLELWRLTESRVTSSEHYAWCLLAYLGA